MEGIEIDKAHERDLEVFTTKLDNYKILGISFVAIDPRKLGEYYGIYERNQSLSKLINEHSKIGNHEIGTMYPSSSSSQNEPENFWSVE